MMFHNLKNANLGYKFPSVAWKEGGPKHATNFVRRIIKKVEDKGEINALQTAHDENRAKESHATSSDRKKGSHEERDARHSLLVTSKINDAE